MATPPPQLIGESALFHALLDRVSDLAALKQPVLIEGERGTGKELIASRLHFLSPRWEQTYIRVNCAAFTDERLEEELFGRMRYDGDMEVDGQLSLAAGGTLFLDNIECVPLRVQQKLLNVLEHGEFESLGGQETETVDIHYIAATSVYLPGAVRAGTFSAELLDRLAFDVLHLPPLRARPDDIAPLTTYFGRKIAASLGAAQFPGLTPEALGFLGEQTWPGNVRELKNVVERSVANAFLADETLSAPVHHIIIDPFENPWRTAQDAPIPAGPIPSAPATDDISPAAPAELITTDFSDRVMTFERSLIDQALKLHEDHQGKAAQYLGLSYHQFRGLLRKHGMKK